MHINATLIPATITWSPEVGFTSKEYEPPGEIRGPLCARNFP